MLDRADHHVAEKIADTLKSVLPSGVTLGIVSMADLKDATGFILFVLNIAYLIWLWRRAAKKKD